jgi:DNA-binding Xre family transcriptional regulator
MASNAKRPQDAYEPPFRDFDEYLKSRGIFEEIKARVVKRGVALQLEELRNERNISKAELARMVGTSRTQIDRVLDPTSQNISLVTLNRVAAALGKKVYFELVDL